MQMWKMVIADDELVILSGLKRLLDWRKLGIEIVGEASDGNALLDEISNKEPDIVITDIKMPKKTGLDVIKQLYTKDICPKFIFVSGYEEFSYAKAAVRYGAVDYLLKPVGMKEFETAVKKAISQIEDNNTVNIFKQEKDEFQLIFQKINNGYEYAEEALYHRFEKEKYDYENVFYVGVCYSLIVNQELKNQMTLEQMELLRFSVYNKIVDTFRKKQMGFTIKKEEYYCDMMAVISLEYKEDYIDTFLLPIKHEIEKEMNVRLCIGIGEPVDTIGFWKNSHKSSKFACELYYFEEKEVIDFQKVNRDYRVSFDDFNHLLEESFQKIAARDTEAIQSIERALKAIENIHYGNRYATVNRVLIFTGALLEKLFVVNLVEGDFYIKQNEVQEEIRYMDTYRQLCNWLISYYEQLIKEIFNQSTNKTSADIMRVKRYIIENFHKDLSLKELAGVACISQSYFSSLFKKETGENYKTYVTKIRMEEAIKLVLKTDMKTYEIAEKVGYNDVRRFVDAFKNSYKISPMEYRKRGRL